MALETTEGSRLAHAHRYLESDTGDSLFLADIDSKEPYVYEFTKQGRFVRRFGAYGGGEGQHEFLQDFTLYRGGLALFSDWKILEFDRAGRYVRERQIDYIPQTVLRSGSDVYATALHLQSRAKDQDHAVVRYTDDLAEIARFSPFDPRLRIHKHVPFNSMAVTSNSVFVTPFLDLGVFEHDRKGQMLRLFDFGERNTTMRGAWKSEMSKDDLREVNRVLKRFELIFATDDETLVLVEKDASASFVLTLFYPSRRQAFRFGKLDLFGASPAAGGIGLERIIGVDNGQLVAVVRNDEFRENIKNAARLPHLNFSSSDNPLLLYLELNPNLAGTLK